MEFWGVEVKAGQTLKVSPGKGQVIHLSQANIGESKKGKDESIPVYVKVDEQKLVIGTLSADKFPQILYDVVFDKDFELSHNWKNGSVFFCGYKAENPDYDKAENPGYVGVSSHESDTDTDWSESESDELVLENAGKALKVEDVKADSDEDSSDEDGSSGSDDDSEDLDEDQIDADDSADEDDSSEEEDEKTPTPKKDNKKRPAEAETRTAVSAKKAKIASPQKTDGKKPASAVHTATPHPAKQVGKTSKGEKSKSPATGGKACNSCSKTFNSEKALEAHSKAKHASK